MDRIRQLLSVLCALIAAFCFIVWAAWFNENLDFVGWARYARSFPLGEDTGPLAVGFGLLFLGLVIYPSPQDARKR